MEPTSTKPLIRQQRALVACTNCRQRKIKCEPSTNQADSACKRCQKHEYHCEYKAVAEDQGQDEYSRRPHQPYSLEERVTSPLSHWQLASMPGYPPPDSSGLYLDVSSYAHHPSSAPYSTQHYPMARSGSDHSIGLQSAYGDFAGAYTNETPYSPCFQTHGLSGGSTTAFNGLHVPEGKPLGLSTSHDSFFMTHDRRAPWKERPMHQPRLAGDISPTSPMEYYGNFPSYHSFASADRGEGPDCFKSGYPGCQCHTCTGFFN